MLDVGRESVIKACAVFDLLEAGWRPGTVELKCARQVERWGLLPATEESPAMLMGFAPSLSPASRIFIAPLFAIDRKARWAWIADEWIVVGEPLEGTAEPDVDGVTSAMTAWARCELSRASA